MRRGDERRPKRTTATPRILLCALLCVGAAGCRHKQVQPIVLPQQTPVALEPVQTPDMPPLLETPKPKLPEVPVAEAASVPKPKKKRSKPAVTPAPAAAEASPATAPAAAPTAPPAAAPAQVAGAEGSPEAAAIGDLTPGGEQSPKTQQEATDLIASNEKRLSALPEAKVKAQRSLVNKVRNFERQAQQAMRSGDADGAKTLATKAKLLLDDLEQEGAGE